ncbi:hypothetical protein JCM11641_003639 [Rhodosporidiobolus odoratus]
MDSIPSYWSLLQHQQPTHRVLACPTLWDSLLTSLSPPDNSTTQLTLAVQHSHASVTPSDGHATLVVRVNQAAQSDMAQVDDSARPTLMIPPALASQHPAVFGQRPSTSSSPPSLLVSISTALPLSSIVLLSLTPHAYDYASNSQQDFEAQLADHKADLVRQGALLSIDGEKRWTVAMAEPVLQGSVVKGYTQLLVLPSVGGEEEEGSSSSAKAEAESSLSAYMASEDDREEVQDDGFDGLDFDDFTIDESFLAASVLAPQQHGSSALPTPLASPLPSKPNGSGLGLGHFTHNSTSPFDSVEKANSSSGGTQCVPVSLSHPVPGELLTPPPDVDEDDVHWAFVATADLGRMGLFSGDWVVLKPAGEDSRRTEVGGESIRRRMEGRLVRVFAADEVIEGGSLRHGTASSLPHIFLPPPLLYNLLGSSYFSASDSVLPFLLLAPAPAVSPTLPPPLPTAASLTLARLASPHSVNKLYQPLFLEGLKEYFQKRRRVVKEGDVIVVGIEEDRVRFLAEGKEVAEDDADLPSTTSAPSAVVHFLITTLTAPPPSPQLLASDASVEIELLMTEGKVGCIVDPKVTTLIQTGVERRRVPDAGSWLGIPSQPLSISPTLLDEPTPASRLYDFLTSSLEPRAKEYGLPLTVLLTGARGSGKKTLVRGVAGKAGIGVLELDCFDLLSDTDLKTEGRIRALAVDKALACAPCVLLLRNIEALARKSQAMETGHEPPMTTVLKECFETIREGWKSSGYPVVVVATTTDIEKVPTGVLGLFKEEIGIEAPAEPERLAILRNLTSHDILAPDVSLRSLAVQTAALVANDLVDLVRRARTAAAERVLQIASSAPNAISASRPSLSHLSHAGVSLTSVDFSSALDKARLAYSESIGAPKIPNVTWDDVGGLANVKSDILDTIQLPLERPELFADGLKKRSGILLYGPPGTGKTLLAKAVATSCSLNFFSVKGPELLNMYIGESEANVRRVFQRARDAKPCVIFFDELDSVAPKRGNQGDSGGVMDRIVSQLLAELDGMSEGKGGNDVFVIGATNRPDLLDPALLRPGRFDRMLYLGVSDTHSAQLKILQALTRKFRLAPETDLAQVAERCPFNYTGADFYALCSDAMLKAMTRKAWEVDARIAALNAEPPYSNGAAPLLTPQYYLAELATPAEIEVLVAQQDFEAALVELVPSVSQAEMLHYKTVQQRFSAETMNSDDKLAEKEKVQQANAALSTAQNGTTSSSSFESAASNGEAVVGAIEKERQVANGLVNGVSDADGVGVGGEGEGEGEAEKKKRRKAKGKGKAGAG